MGSKTFSSAAEGDINQTGILLESTWLGKDKVPPRREK